MKREIDTHTRNWNDEKWMEEYEIGSRGVDSSAKHRLVALAQEKKKEKRERERETKLQVFFF